MSNYYSGDGLGLGQLGAVADKVPATSPLSSVGQTTETSFIPSPVSRALWVAGWVSVPALAYHGYKRNDSVGWALVWGLFGSIVWPITVPVALAQGYAKPRRRVRKNRRSRPKKRRTSKRRRRRTSRRSR